MMRLLMITAFDSVGAELAAVLSANGNVTVLHPGVCPIECRFHERTILPQELLSAEVAAYDAVIYLASDKLETAYLEHLMVRLRESAIPCICVEPRMISVREGTPTSAVEALCRYCQEKYALPVSWISVPALYGDDFLPDMWMDKLLKRAKSNRLTLQGDPDDECDLLHIRDAASLLHCLALDHDRPRALTIGSGYASDLKSILQVLQAHFQLADIHLSRPFGEGVRILADDYPQWTPSHSFIQDLPHVLREMEAQRRFEHLQRRHTWRRRVQRLIAFALLFGCVCLYTGFIRVSSELQFVDVRLLFVICVSLYMGRGYGMAAGLCSSIASIAEAIAAGNRWHTIFFHIDNWIPIAVYIAAAVLFGMYSENHRIKDSEENGL